VSKCTNLVWTDLEGKLKKPLPDGRELFVTTRVDPQLADRLSQSDVKFTGVIESTWLRDLLSWVLPVLFFFAIWQFLFVALSISKVSAA